MTIEEHYKLAKEVNKLTEDMPKSMAISKLALFGDAAGTGLTDSQCKAYVMSATSNGHAVAICSTSYGTLPGYPSNEVGHWLASDGYYNNGDKIWIADPAKSSEVSWSNSISASYDVSASTLNNFVGWKGIVW